MRKQHVFHIVESTGGGVLKYLLEITDNLNRGKFRHTILYSPRELTPKNLREQFHEDVNLIEIPMMRGIDIIKDLKVIRSIQKELKLHLPNIVHLHSSKAGFLGRLACFINREKKVFYTLHVYSFLISNENIFRRGLYLFAEFFLSQLKGSIIACSKSEYRYAKKLNWFRKNYLLENGMKLDYKNVEQKNKGQVIGIGRLDQQKNPFLFIKIISELKKRDPDIKAIWVGDGPLYNDCRQLDFDLQTDITFTGWLERNDVMKVLSSSSVFLQTSRWEGLPFSILESMALGVPTIATNIESHKDVINHGVNGLIAKDESEFVEQTIMLLSDQKLYRNISENSLMEFKARFSDDVFIKELTKIYND